MPKENSTEVGQDPKNISFTADHHPYWRTFFEGLGPWVKDMSELTQSERAFHASLGVGTEDMIPVFDARYMGTSKAVKRLINELGITQVVSYGAGMEEVGIDIVSGNPNVKYLETDISDNFRKKPQLVDIIFERYGLPNKGNLFFYNADIRNPDEIAAAFKHADFSTDKPVLGFTQGVIDYYKKPEIIPILAIQRGIMNRFGNGKSRFVTPDFSFDDVIIPVLFKHTKKLREIMARMEKKTGRSYDKGLGDGESTDKFLAEQGLRVEKYGRDELGYRIGSLDKVGLTPEVRAYIEENLRKYMKVFVLSPK